MGVSIMNVKKEKARTTKVRPKIAIISPFYWPSIAGVETVARDTAEELVRRGYSVSVITTTHNWMWEKIAESGIETINGVDVHRLNPEPVRAGYATVMSGLKDTIKKIKPDLVHSHDLHPHLFQVIRWQNELNYRIIAQLHFPEMAGAEGPIAKIAYPFVKRYLMHLNSKVCAFVANTNGERHWFIEQGVKAERVHKITYPCVPSSLLDIKDNIPKDSVFTNKIVLLYIGRITLKKGIHILLKAIPDTLKAINNNLEVVIAGPRDYAYFAKMVKLSKELGINNYVKWKNTIVGSEKYEQLLGCTIFVSPSLQDVHPITLIEAQALGKPVISTNVGLISEIVRNNQTGILVDPDDPKKLSQAIVYLALNKNRRKTMSEEARKFVERDFLLENSIDLLERLYSRCISSGRL
jgi:glycosyltransferase involved in cell wall biosynthesis